MPRLEKPIPKTVLSRRNFLRLGIGAGAGALLKPLETLATPDNNDIEVQQQVDALVIEFLDPEGNIEVSQFITKLFQAYEIRTSPSPLEPNKFRYRASDGLPEVGISTQTAYIKGAQMYGETATVVPLSELSTANPEGKLVLLKTTESIYGTNQYSEAYFVNQDRSGRQQWLNLQARVNNQDLLIDPVALQERADVTEAAVIDPARFKAYDDQVTTYLKGHDDGVQRSLPKLSPRVEREEEKPHPHLTKVIHYGNYEAWGYGRYFENVTDPEQESVEKYLEYLWERHKMVEEYFGQEIPIAHFDLIILTGEARELVFRNSNEMSITEEMIWATKGYFEARGKQVEYSFDLRIPPGYTSSEFVASPEDEVLNFLENIFIRKDEAFSRRLQNAITQREIAIGLSIDPELPAYQNNQLLYNSSPLTGKSINNIYFTYRWLYEKTFNANPGEVFVYLAGTTMSDAFIRELGQMNPNVGLVHAGIGVQSHKREALDRWSEGLGSTSWTRGIMLYLAHFSPYLETEQYRDDLGGVESRNLLTREEYEQMMQEQVHEAFRSTKDSFVNTVALQ